MASLSGMTLDRSQAMSFWQTMRIAARTWRRTPVLAAVITSTLALGIGATTAAFTIAYSILVRQFPFPNAERLVWITTYDSRTAENRRPVIGSNRLPQVADWARPAWFVQAVRVADGIDRDRLVEVLGRMGVEAKAYFEPAIHRQPPYAGDDSLLATPLPETEAASARTLIVPFWAAMTEDHVARVAGALTAALDEVGRR